MSEHEGSPSDIDLLEALGLICDSPTVGWRLRLLDALGEETARLTGVLAYEGDEGFARLVLSIGGLSAAVTIPLDQGTRCTNSPDGTIKGRLPNGESKIVTPLWTERDGD